MRALHLGEKGSARWALDPGPILPVPKEPRAQNFLECTAHTVNPGLANFLGRPIWAIQEFVITWGRAPAYYQALIYGCTTRPHEAILSYRILSYDE